MADGMCNTNELSCGRTHFEPTGEVLGADITGVSVEQGGTYAIR